MVPLLAAPGLSSPDAVAQAAGSVALTADKAKPAVDQPVTLTAKVRKTGSISEGVGMAGEGPRRRAESARRGPGGRALHGLGILLAESGEANRALAQCQASCALFRRAGELAWVARSLNSQGGIARDLGDLARAEQLFSESFELRRELGDGRASLAIVLGWRRQVRSTKARRPRAHLRGGSRRRSQRGRREVGYLTTRCRILAPSVQPPASQCPSRQRPALRLPWREARRTTPRSRRAASHGRNTRSALSGAGTTLGAPLREMSGACGDAFTPAQLTVRALSAA